MDDLVIQNGLLLCKSRNLPSFSKNASIFLLLDLTKKGLTQRNIFLGDKTYSLRPCDVYEGISSFGGPVEFNKGGPINYYALNIYTSRKLIKELLSSHNVSLDSILSKKSETILMPKVSLVNATM